MYLPPREYSESSISKLGQLILLFHLYNDTNVITALAELVAMAFDPPAEYLYRWGSYFAPCDATPPSFAIIISGVEFWIDPSHMIYPNLVDPVTGYCSIAVSSGQSGPYVLGDVFLQNVLAVFDIGGAQMRFYSRR